MNLPTQDLTLAPALLLAIGAIACAALAWLSFRHFGDVHFGGLVAPSTEETIT